MATRNEGVRNGTRRGNRPPARALVLLPLVALLATLSLACADITIRESAERRQPDVVLSAGKVQHDLAVAGVNFDSGLGAGPGQQATGRLIVVIENRGSQRASGIAVRARLMSASGAEMLAEQVTEVALLAGGETKAVAFSQMPEIPLRNRYQLIVEVAPVTGEVDIVNNKRTFDLQAGINNAGGGR